MILHYICADTKVKYMCKINKNNLLQVLNTYHEIETKHVF